MKATEANRCSHSFGIAGCQAVKTAGLRAWEGGHKLKICPPPCLEKGSRQPGEQELSLSSTVSDTKVTGLSGRAFEEREKQGEKPAQAQGGCTSRAGRAGIRTSGNSQSAAAGESEYRQYLCGVGRYVLPASWTRKSQDSQSRRWRSQEGLSHKRGRILSGLNLASVLFK